MARTMTDEEFAEFVQAAWPGLYRTAYLMLGDHQLAEDLVQASLAKTYASWRKIKEPAAAPAYARVVLANTAASWFRRRGWRNEHPTEVLPDAGTEHDLTTRTAVVDALATLAPRQRAVVVLRYYDDLSVREVAHALGISEGTVKSQTSDALARLRDVLDDEAAAVSVPAADPAAVVGQGRRIRRDRRVRVATAVTAVLAVIGVGIGIGIAARDEPKRISPAEQVYLTEGAWIDGEDVHVGDHTVRVPGAFRVGYTSAGALVIPWDPDNSKRAVSPLTLVRPDGSTRQVDAPGIEELPGTDPATNNVAYVRPVGDGYERWELVVLDVSTGKTVATVPYDDKVTTGSGVAPEVELHGDTALFLIGGQMKVVDWRTGKRVPAPSKGVGIRYQSAYGAGSYVVADTPPDQPVDHWQVRSWTDGSVVGEFPGGQTAELSPDGRYLKVSRSAGFTVYDVASARQTVFGDDYSWSDYGWSPDGHLVGRAPNGSEAALLQSCDPVEGTCVDVGKAHSPQVLFVRGALNLEPTTS